MGREGREGVVIGGSMRKEKEGREEGRKRKKTGGRKEVKVVFWNVCKEIQGWDVVGVSEIWVE